MEFLTLFDGIVIAVVLISAFLAMYRGFLREVFSIAAWVAAALVAYLFHPQLLPIVKQYINNDYVALGVTIGSLFVVTLLVVSYITMKLSDFVLDSAFGALDRSAGFLFGAARGVLLFAVVMAFVNGLVEDKNQPPWIANAKSKPLLTFLGQQIKDALPADAEGKLIEIGRRTRVIPEQQPDTEDDAPEPPASTPRATTPTPLPRPAAPAAPAAPGGQRT